MKKIKDQEIKDYVATLTSFQKDIVMKIREAVLSADPKIQEGIKWSSIAFYNEKNICGYRVAKAHVTLLFMEGASLDDKHGILEGTGAKARTIKVTNAEDIPVEGIKGLVKDAIKKGM